MAYEQLSDEKLYQLLKDRFPGAIFKPVTEKSRPIAIQLLKFFDEKEGGQENVQPEDQWQWLKAKESAR